MNQFQKDLQSVMRGEALATLSREWPPVLADDETIRLSGRFHTGAWARNLGFWIGLFLIAIFWLSSPETRLNNATIAVLAAGIGAAVAYFIHCRQEWVLSDRAIYVKGRKPMHLAAVKRIYGVGSVVKISGANWHNLSLVGVKDAHELRAGLRGVTL